MYTRILIALCIQILLATQSRAQIDPETVDSIVRSCVLSYDEIGGFIEFQENKIESGELFTLYQSFFNDTSNEFKLHSSQTDTIIGLTHNRYKQFYKGIPVQGAELIEHSNNGWVLALNGQFANPELLATNYMTKGEAFTALDTEYDGWTGDEQWAWENDIWEAELQEETGDTQATYFPYFNGQLIWAITGCKNINYYIPDECIQLCWRFEVFCLSPFFKRAYYLDAYTGQVVKIENLIHTDGVADILYYGPTLIDTKSRGWPYNDFTLRADNGTHNVHTKYFYNEPNTTSNTSENGTAFSLADEISDSDDSWETNDQRATSVHHFATVTWDYFKGTFGHSGTKGNGNKIKIRVDGPWDNRYTHYDEDGEKLVISSTNSGIFLGTLDVVAHEFTHGITEHSAELNYQFESGALNESFSDIFSVLVEREYEPTTWNWTIGEDALTIRNLMNPGAAGNHFEGNIYPCEYGSELGQPDTYHGNWWYFGDDCDEGGVHVNSGPHNRWFSLIVNGGTHNGVDVTGIGFDFAEILVFYTLKYMLTEFSNYISTRAASQYAASSIFGACSVNHQFVSDAWDAIEVPGAPANCYPQAINSLSQDIPDFDVFPNPATSSLTLISTIPMHGTLNILTIDGKVAQSEVVDNSNSHTIQLKITQGVYLATFTSTEGTFATRFIKE